MNPTLRKQFVYYAMTTNVTNLDSMTRSSFIKFVRDCEIDSLPAFSLTEADLVNIFAKACGASKSMTFYQWLAACQILFQRVFPLQTVVDEQLEALVNKHVIPKARCIQAQNLAPDVSLLHVMKLLREHIWQFKQIFSHFGIQSLVEELIADSCFH
uniref:Uncharacterized protein n=1 Tax=Globisporangium ultimum (strain ATCC 200006 / CBS 805.95 / DAOM BR144) TaxID=431595 RepID=K3X8P7_GLOUD